MIRVLEYNVLIKQDEVAAKIGSLHLTAESQEIRKHQATEGVIAFIADKAGESIWSDDDTRPKVGDRVIFAQHAGCFVKDGAEEYRVVKDKDIVAVFHE